MLVLLIQNLLMVWKWRICECLRKWLRIECMMMFFEMFCVFGCSVQMLCIIILICILVCDVWYSVLMICLLIRVFILSWMWFLLLWVFFVWCVVIFCLMWLMMLVWILCGVINKLWQDNLCEQLVSELNKLVKLVLILGVVVSSLMFLQSCVVLLL